MDVMPLWTDPWSQAHSTADSTYSHVGLPQCHPEEVYPLLLARVVDIVMEGSPVDAAMAQGMPSASPHPADATTTHGMRKALHAPVNLMIDSMSWLSNAAKHGMQAYPQSAVYGFLNYPGIISCLKIIRESLPTTLCLCNQLILMC